MVGESFDWAAWVQAVGSVVAILAAVWIARQDAIRQRVKDREATARALSVFTQIAFRAAMAAAEAHRYASGDGYVEKPLDVFGHEILQVRTVRESIERIALETVDVPEAAITFLLLIHQHLVRIEGLLTKEKRHATDGLMIEATYKLVDQVRDDLMKLSDEARAAANRKLWI